MTGQSTAIKQKIIEFLDKGMTDKSEIYDKVQRELEVPRPTVRRACKDLVDDLRKKVSVLRPEVAS